MYGRIRVLALTANDNPVPPNGLEYGLSLSRTIPPTGHQLSSVFEPVADGTYYIWWRQIGAEWDAAQVIKEVVLCQNIANNEALIESYFEEYGGIETVNSYNFPAKNTVGASNIAIEAGDEYDQLQMDKIVLVFIDGQMVLWKNGVPLGGDKETMIYNDAGTIKWHASNAGYELSDDQIVTICQVE